MFSKYSKTTSTTTSIKNIYIKFLIGFFAEIKYKIRFLEKQYLIKKCFEEKINKISSLLKDIRKILFTLILSLLLSKYSNQRNWVFDTSSNFLITISVQPDGINQCSKINPLKTAWLRVIYLSRRRIEAWMLEEKGVESTSRRINQLEVYLLNLPG